MPEARITRRGKLDNYWHMGVPGPGGPCSEIYLDRGRSTAGGGPAVDEDRYLEFWNLVFMQEELSAVRAKDDFDIVGPLPQRNIDTGMGLERMATLLQGVDNLYEIDEVYPVLERAAELTGKRYGARSGHSAGPATRTTCGCASSPTTCAPRSCSSATASPRQRGSRLRPAPDAAPLGALDAPPRVRGPVPARAAPGLRGADAAVLPRARTGFDRISQIAYAEEEAFRRTLTAGRRSSTRRSRAPRSPADACGRPGVPAARHLRLPHRPDPGDGAEQGLQVDREGFAQLMQEQRQRQGRREVEAVRPREHRGVARPARAGATDFPPTRS